MKRALYPLGGKDDAWAILRPALSGDGISPLAAMINFVADMPSMAWINSERPPEEYESVLLSRYIT